MASGRLEAVDQRLLGRERPSVPSLYAEELSSASASAGGSQAPGRGFRRPGSVQWGAWHLPQAHTHSLRAGHAPITPCVTSYMRAHFPGPSSSQHWAPSCSEPRSLEAPEVSCEL